MRQILIRRLLSFLKPYRVRLLAALSAGGIVALCTAAYPTLMKSLFDDLLIRKDQRTLFILPSTLIGLALLKGLAAYAESAILKSTGIQIVRHIREGLYRRLLLLPLGHHLKRATGELLSSVLHDVQLMESALSVAIRDTVRQTLTLAALTTVLFYQNFKLALLAFFLVPLFIVPLSKISAALRRFALWGQEKMGDLSAHLQETLAGIRIVKAFGKEGFESHRFEALNAAYRNQMVKAVRIAEIAPPLMETCAAIGVAMVVAYMGAQVLQDALTPGDFMAFVMVCILMYGPIKILSATNNLLQPAFVAAERVFSIWDETAETEKDTGHDIKIVKGEVTFRDISFWYEGAASPALRHIDFTLQPGTIVALVGPSGAGKSTLTHLIQRFYLPTEGVIFLDGIPLQEISLTSLRRQIGLVPQEVVLFDETVRWNIAYGADNPSEEAIQKAAEAAYADLFIRKMPHGYNTWLEKGGSNLSGGERQRLAIARAILRDPPLLILDEATSALDAESEYLVQKAIDRLLANRTILVIAHRFSTVLRADCIVVMDKGRIVEMGRHEALMQKNGVYRRIYLTQFQGAPASALGSREEGGG